MKKTLVLLTALSIFVFVAGCTPFADPSAGQQDEWGIELSAQDVTPTGITLVCRQSGGNAAGELQTGSPFSIDQLVEGEWRPVPTVMGIHDWAWTMEGWMIQRDSTTRWEVSWEFLYGDLAPGTYRMAKKIMEFRGPGDYTERTYYAQFDIVP